MNTSDMVFLAIFFWGMFLVARIFIYAAKIDIQTKKKTWPIVIVGLGVTTLFAAYLFQLPIKFFYIWALVTVGIVFVNLRGFYFCETCERMMAHKDVFNKPESCSNCKGFIH